MMRELDRHRAMCNTLEKLGLSFWLPALLCLGLVHLVWEGWVNTRGLVFDLKVERGGIFQVFFDEGHGFSEEQSLRFPVEADGDSQRFDIDLSTFPETTTLRIDPVDHDGAAWLRRFEFKSAGSWLRENLMQERYEPAHGIARWHYNAALDELAIYPEQGNHDPQFYWVLTGHQLQQEAALQSRILHYVAAIAVGVVVGFLTRSFWISVVAWLVVAVGLPPVLFRKWRLSYTLWVDRMSMRFGLVHPTSCVAAGLIAAGFAVLVTMQGDLHSERDKRMAGVFEWDWVSGHTDACGVFLITERGLRLEHSVYHRMEPSSPPGTVRVPLNPVDSPIRALRFDPMDGLGELTVGGLRLIRADGKRKELPLDWNWRINAALEKSWDADAGVLNLRGIAEDPHMVSPEFEFDLNTRATLPVIVVVPLFWFLLTSLGLLLYNHVACEGLTMQEIRSMR